MYPSSLKLMQEFLREGSSLYKWVVGETANHMGYVKSNENSKFQNFEPHLSMVNQLFSKFVQLRKCGKSSYLSIAENKS
jgi:hypothetical protein